MRGRGSQRARRHMVRNQDFALMQATLWPFMCKKFPIISLEK